MVTSDFSFFLLLIQYVMRNFMQDLVKEKDECSFHLEIVG